MATILLEPLPSSLHRGRCNHFCVETSGIPEETEQRPADNEQIKLSEATQMPLQH